MNRPIRILSRCCLFAALAFAPSGLVAQTLINTFGGWDGTTYVYPFGQGGTQTYGQTITAPTDNFLTSFTFSMNLPASVSFAGYVYQWDPGASRAMGPALYTSTDMSTGGTGAFELVTFNVPNLRLTVGTQYVLFATVINRTGSGSGNWAQPSNTNPYSGGAFVYLNSSLFSDLTGTSWTLNHLGTGGDLAFKAQFAAIPEPSTLVLLGMGAAGVGLTRWRRRIRA